MLVQVTKAFAGVNGYVGGNDGFFDLADTDIRRVTKQESPSSLVIEANDGKFYVTPTDNPEALKLLELNH